MLIDAKCISFFQLGLVFVIILFNLGSYEYLVRLESKIRRCVRILLILIIVKKQSFANDFIFFYNPKLGMAERCFGALGVIAFASHGQ